MLFHLIWRFIPLLSTSFYVIYVQFLFNGVFNLMSRTTNFYVQNNEAFWNKLFKTLIKLNFALLHIINDNQLLFLLFNMAFNNSYLFISILNSIWFNLHFMDMKKHILIYFFPIHVGG